MKIKHSGGIIIEEMLQEVNNKEECFDCKLILILSFLEELRKLQVVLSMKIQDLLKWYNYSKNCIL